MAVKVESASELPPAAAFIDTENLFKPFRHNIDPARDRNPSESSFERSLQKSREAAERFFGEQVDYAEVHMLGPAVVVKLIGWLHERYAIMPNHGRSYGSHNDAGVNAVWRKFVHAFDWTHTMIRPGHDRADEALISDVGLFSHSPAVDILVIGSSDRARVLVEAAAAAGDKSLIAVLGPVNSQDFHAFFTNKALSSYAEVFRLNAIYRDQVYREKQALTSGSVATSSGQFTQLMTRARRELDIERRELNAVQKKKQRVSYDKVVDDLLADGLEEFRDVVASRIRQAAAAGQMAQTGDYLLTAVKKSTSPLRYDALAVVADLIAVTATPPRFPTGVATFPEASRSA